MSEIVVPQRVPLHMQDIEIMRCTTCGAITPGNWHLAEKAERRNEEIRRYIDEDFRFWCSPHGVAGRYAKALLEFMDRLDGQEPGRGTT